MLHLAMAVGLVAGLVFGLLAGALDATVLLAVVDAVEPLGRLFINAIRMVVVPLVVLTIFVGVARLGSPRRIGRMGAWALGFFWVTTVPAILLGMGVMAAALPWAPEVAVRAASVEAPTELPGLVDFLVGLVPSNPFEAATEGDLLGLIVFTTLFAGAVGTLDAERRERVLSLAEDLNRALVTLVRWVLWTAPVGIFALAAPVVARSGWEMLGTLAVFVVGVVTALALFVALVYLPAVRFLGAIALRRFLRGAYPGMIVGFTTTSSVATLPVLLESADDVGVSPPVASFVLSLGAAINRGGSALFQGAAVVFLAHLYGVPFPLSAVAGAVLATFLAALSVAPVPSASVMTLAPALDVVGVPLDGLGLLLGIDRIPDMFRSAVNQMGHMAGAVVVERRAGGGDALTPDAGSASGPPPSPAGPERNWR